nr:DUF308 domain-containing protein [Actinomyces sp.]
MLPEIAKRSATTMLVFGVFSVLWGLLLVANPGVSAAALAVFWGAFALVDGVATLVLAFQEKTNRGWNIASGVLGLIAGLIVMVNPGTGLVVAGWTFGFWLIFRGIAQISVIARALSGSDKVFTVIGAILWIIAGVLAIVFPAMSAITFVWVLGVLAIVWGAQLVFSGIRTQRLAKDLEKEREERVVDAPVADVPAQD